MIFYKLISSSETFSFFMITFGTAKSKREFSGYYTNVLLSRIGKIIPEIYYKKVCKLVGIFENQAIKDDYPWKYFGNIGNLWNSTGDISKSLKSWCNYLESKEYFIREKGLDKFNIRIINPYPLASTIGNVGHLDGFLKLVELGVIPKQRFIIPLPESSAIKFCNEHFVFNYLCNYLEMIHVKELPRMIRKNLEPLNQFLCGPLRLNDRIYPYNHTALSNASKLWELENREPLFKLSDEDLLFGREILVRLGLPKDAWYVCLHIRDDSFKGAESFRDSKLQSYEMAIKSIASRGGWIIRMGIKATPVASNCGFPNFIDYANSEFRNSRMDVFLASQCAFFLGTSSGLYTLALTFGRPILLTNYSPMSSAHLKSTDYILPRLVKRMDNKTASSLNVILTTPYNLICWPGMDKYLGVEMIENSPEDIAAAVEEMFRSLEGKLYPDEMESYDHIRKITERYETLPGGHGDSIPCRIPAFFTQKYSQTY
jgi:putative glycosyltransferase (TIGR04372 family)